MKQTISKISILFMVVFALTITSSCEKADLMGPLKAEALKLVAEHSDKLTSIGGKWLPMLAKINAIPDSVPGAKALKAKFAEKAAAMAGVKGLVDGAPAAIEAAIKGKDMAGLTAVVDGLKGGGPILSGIESFMGESGGQIGELEKLAAAAKAAAAGGVALDWTKKLSTGYELKGTSAGIENMLVTYLDDAKMDIDKTKWFNFDRVTFASGSSKINMAKSKDQLTNMLEIMKAYPTAEIKIGGYTDNTGSLEGNMKISQKRADAVMAALTASGVVATRMTAEGFGPKHPVCEANDTAECKAKNRRISVNVRKK